MILISEEDGGTFIGLDTCTGAQLAAAAAEARRKRAESDRDPGYAHPRGV